MQNDLPLGMFATAGYLGTKGTRLDQQFIPNSVAPGAAESLLPHDFIYETSNGEFDLPRGAVPVESALPQRHHGER